MFSIVQSFHLHIYFDYHTSISFIKFNILSKTILCFVIFTYQRKFNFYQMLNCHILFSPFIFKIYVLYKMHLSDEKYFLLMGFLISKTIFVKTPRYCLQVLIKKALFLAFIYFYLYFLNSIRCNSIFS